MPEYKDKKAEEAHMSLTEALKKMDKEAQLSGIPIPPSGPAPAIPSMEQVMPPPPPVEEPKPDESAWMDDVIALRRKYEKYMKVVHPEEQAMPAEAADPMLKTAMKCRADRLSDEILARMEKQASVPAASPNELEEALRIKSSNSNNEPVKELK